MEIKPIRTDEDNRRALDRALEILDYDEGTPEYDEVDVLFTLIEAYESFKYPIDFPDPIGAIEFHLDRLGLRVRDLIPCIGSYSKVVAVLEKREPLTLEMIRRLCDRLDVSADILIQRYYLVN